MFKVEQESISEDFGINEVISTLDLNWGEHDEQIHEVEGTRILGLCDLVLLISLHVETHIFDL